MKIKFLKHIVEKKKISISIELFFFIYVLAVAPISSRGSVFEGIAKEVLN